MDADEFTYAVVTFGCRVNQADSLVIEEGLRRCGGRAVASADAALVVVNTCSVTARADQAARQTIRRIARANPDVKVVVTGCYATRSRDEVVSLPNVVGVVENLRKETLARDIVEDLALARGRFMDGDGPCGMTLTPGVAGRTALTLRIQTGCEERCTYCIIPRTRGASRSRPLPDVLGDVERAVSAGYKEISITGVHLGSYGRDLDDGSSLTRLVRALAATTENVLFRISSLEPMDCTPDIVEAVSSSPRLAPHFHLPLQHGADEILRAMCRPYTTSYYEQLVVRIRQLIPDASIGSDIIVGFPGETAGHVATMRDLLERLPLSYLHVFPYSDRPGTAASRLRVKVAGAEIRQRASEIRAIGEKMATRFRESQTGSVVRALTVDDGRSAVTANYLKLPLAAPRPRNEWIFLRVPPPSEAAQFVSS